MDDFQRFKEMKRLFDEATEALSECETLLREIWRETKDTRIEALFRKAGGLMIDGKYMFGPDRSKE